MRLNLNWRYAKFFLFPVNGGAIRNGGKNEFCPSKKNYVNWFNFASAYGDSGVGGRRTHFDKSFFCVITVFYPLLHNLAWSFGLLREEVIFFGTYRCP